MAVVIGATSVKSRNKAAAGLLAKRLFAADSGGLTLAALQPPGASVDQATNMREALCTKAGSTALRKKERELAAKNKKEGKPGRPPIFPSATGRVNSSRSASEARPARLPMR